VSGVRHAIPTVLLFAGVALEVIAVVGVSVMRDVLDRLHYVGLAGFGALLVGISILCASSFSLIGDKALLAGVLLVTTGPVMVHTTARSLRDRCPPRGGRHVTALQAVALFVVVVAGTAIVFVPDPLRQALVLSMFGLALTLLFFVFQAPDVALSELVVGGVGMPVIILAALRKIARHAARHEEEESGE
jgi:energy-converting hydrogenase B subunit D